MAVNDVKELFEFLGPPQRRAMLRSESGAQLDRTIWSCGCVAHQIGDDVSAQWEKCPLHLRVEPTRGATAESNLSC
jgi:hypothetical protein